MNINGVRIFLNEAQTSNARQEMVLVSCPFSERIYLLISAKKCHFHVSILSIVSCCIFRVLVVVDEGNHAFR
jgi:hypothetical protein